MTIWQQQTRSNDTMLIRFRLSLAAGKSVGCSVVEAFGDDPQPQELEEVLRLEYRSKLLNPKVTNGLRLQCDAPTGLHRTSSAVKYQGMSNAQTQPSVFCP